MTHWLPVETAPRDGSPVLLWIEDRDAPPIYPVTVGVWSVDHLDGARFWHVFSKAFDGSSAYFDDHVRGWMPLPEPS